MIFSKIEISFGEFIRKDGFVRLNSILAIILNLANWILIYYRFTRFLSGQEESIILHYSIYFGIDKYGSWSEIYSFPLVGAIIILINLILAYLLYSKDKLISYFLLTVAVFSQILIGLGIIFIIIINQYY